MNEPGIMFEYYRSLKTFSRDLRNGMTDAEILLWSRLRKRQVLGTRFYRQKPLLSYIVDFYSDQAKLVIECDGSQHYEAEHAENDKERDEYLNQQGIYVLRFDNLQIIQEIESVMEVIANTVKMKIQIG